MTSRRTRLALIAVSALITGFSVILPHIFGFLVWFSLIPAFLAVMSMADDADIGLKEFYLAGLLFYFVYAIVYFHWFIALYPLDFTGLDAFGSVCVVIVAWFGLALLHALGGGLVFLVFGAFAKIGAYRRVWVLKPILFSALFILYEYFLTLGWWGVPWARLALSQINALPILQTASLFGSYFVSAVILGVNALLSCAVSLRHRISQSRIIALSALGIFCLNLVTGGILFIKKQSDFENSEKITVAAIQGNNSISTTKTVEQIYHDYARLTREAAKAGAELIVWPETALTEVMTPDDIYGIRVSALASEYGVTIAVGSMKYENKVLSNCTYFVDENGNFSDTVYEKRHLVPFGEYMPMRDFLTVIFPFLAEVSMLEYDMKPGKETDIYYADGIGNVCSIICFDSIYEELTLSSVRDGAELILLSTNDSWFKESIAVYMHASQAKLRSIETGRCTVRAACTGISMLISPTGESYSEVQVFDMAYSLGEVTVESDLTLYTVIGNAFVYFIALGVAVLFAFELYRSYKDKRLSTDLSMEDEEMTENG